MPSEPKIFRVIERALFHSRTRPAGGRSRVQMRSKTADALNDIGAIVTGKGPNRQTECPDSIHLQKAVRTPRTGPRAVEDRKARAFGVKVHSNIREAHGTYRLPTRVGNIKEKRKLRSFLNMINPRLPCLTVLLALLTLAAFARDDKPPIAPKAPSAPAVGETKPDQKADAGEVKAPAKSAQSAVASKTAKFEKIAKTDESVKSSLDAHELAGGMKEVGKNGAIKGVVSRVFAPGAVAILNFDADYKTAMTAVVMKTNFDKLPDLQILVGRSVVVTGTFAKYRDAAQIVVTNASQIKLVE
jgi:hypothetical protein